MGTMTDISNNPRNELRYGLVEGARLGGMHQSDDAYTNATAGVPW